MAEEETVPEVPVPEEAEPITEPVESEPEWVGRHFKEVHHRLDLLAEAHLNHLKAHETVPEVEKEVERNERPLEVVSVDVTPEKEEPKSEHTKHKRRRF